MLIEINEKVRSLSESGGEAGVASGRAVALAEMFGVGLDEEHALTLYDGLRLDILRGDVVYVTGGSGCGKSVLMRALARELRRRLASGGGEAADPEGPLAVLDDVSTGGGAAVIDRFPGSLEDALRAVSVAGLNDAFLLLRPPGELSEGQRYRYRLAMLLAGGAGTILIDEFCSTLDRRTARAVAYRVRKYATATGRTFVVATSHDDLAEDLRPDLVVRKRSGSAVEVSGR